MIIIIIIYYHYKTVSAAVKDTTFNGVGGLNIELSAPFKFKDYIVGFNYNVVGNNKYINTNNNYMIINTYNNTNL